MEDISSSSSSSSKRVLHSCSPLRRTLFNRLFAALYASTLFAFFYHTTTALATSETKVFSSLLLLADLILAFQWAAAQSFRMRPVCRSQFPENLDPASPPPAVDIFICTADPYKEPPMGVVNTALSVLAYDYPQEKISVYISDDGGSQLTLFAFMEAARFATHWLPFCRENNVQARSPEAFFSSSYTPSRATDEIKVLYEGMKTRVGDVIENGKVEDEHIRSIEDRVMFNKWTPSFTRQNHPTIIQVLLDKRVHVDRDGKEMPNLIYVSREKSVHHHHNFKAGALNTLLWRGLKFSSMVVFTVFPTGHSRLLVHLTGNPFVMGLVLGFELRRCKTMCEGEDREIGPSDLKMEEFGFRDGLCCDIKT